MVAVVPRHAPTPSERTLIEALAGDFEPAWYTSLNADQDRPAWYLAYTGDQLVGFLTVFDPSGASAEVSGYVEPSWRRRGVFKALLNEARRYWDTPGRRWLLVAERSQKEATAVATKWGGLAFTEWTLGLAAPDRPPFAGLPPGLLLAEGTEDDLDAAADVFRLAHGEEDGHRPFLERILADPERRFLVLKAGDQVVAVGCLHRETSVVMVHGLVVRPDRQGLGWGRALMTALLDLSAPGTTEFLIEVDSTNARAESLYRSLGFQDRQMTDYYQM